MSDLDYEAAGDLYRLQSYAPKVPERTWDRLAPGAKQCWIGFVVAVLDVALRDEPLYREATASEWATGKIHSQDMPIVQVWPKED